MRDPRPDEQLSRRERERLMRRRAMLRAAQAVFAEKGYARATLDEIAERAEFGKGTLYNYFEGGKEEILFAVFDQIYDEICDLIREVFSPEKVADQSLRTAFHEFVQAYFNFFQERDDLFMILMKETHRLAFSEETGRATFFQQQQERMVSTLAPVLKQSMGRDEIQQLPPEAVAHMLLANVNGVVAHRCLSERFGDCGTEDTILHRPEKAADFLTTMLFDGMVTSPPAESSAARTESTNA